VGYVLAADGVRYYHAGDTRAAEALIASVRAIGPIDVAILPVNERNFFRERRGIIGNMSVREAFGLAVELGCKRVIPCHWDMFAPNRVYREEIDLIYSRMAPPFELDLRAPERSLA
jgi:L-ascorbate 6-phosphate lactonase